MKFKDYFHLLFLFPASAFGCEELSGKYASVSETHWGYVLDVSADETILTSSDHWFGAQDLVTSITQTEHGLCSKYSDNSYEFKFGDRTLVLEYHSKLSKKSYGEEGSSPGFTGNFHNGQLVELWKVGL